MRLHYHFFIAILSLVLTVFLIGGNHFAQSFNKSGPPLIQTNYTAIRPYNNNRAAVKIDKKWGYINRNGQLVVQPRFDSARNFSEGRAPVKINGRWGYINRSGSIVIEPEFIRARPFHSGYSTVKKQKWGYIDKRGDTVTQFRFSAAGPFNDKRGWVQVNDRFGALNREGEWAIKPQFHDAKPFYYGKAPARKGKRWGYINKTGDTITQYKYKWAQSLRNGWHRILTNGNQWHYRDKNGTIIKHEPAIINSAPAANQYAVVQVKRGPALLKQSGGIIPYYNYEQISHPEHGLVPVKDKGRWGVLTVKDKKTVLPTTYQAVKILHSDIIAVYHKKGWQIYRRRPKDDAAKWYRAQSIARSVYEQFVEPYQNDAPLYASYMDQENGPWVRQSTLDQKANNYWLRFVEITKYPYTVPTPHHELALKELYRATFNGVKENNWFTLKEARSDGYRLPDIAPVTDAHRFKKQYIHDTRTLVPDRPEYLMFSPKTNCSDTTIPSTCNTRFSSVMYYFTNTNHALPQIGGPLSPWHYHYNRTPLCVKNGHFTSLKTKSNCLKQGGTVSRQTPPMVHVWFIKNKNGYHTHVPPPSKQIQSLYSRPHPSNLNRTSDLQSMPSFRFWGKPTRNVAEAFEKGPVK